MLNWKFLVDIAIGCTIIYFFIYGLVVLIKVLAT